MRITAERRKRLMLRFSCLAAVVVTVLLIVSMISGTLPAEVVIKILPHYSYQLPGSTHFWYWINVAAGVIWAASLVFFLTIESRYSLTKRLVALGLGMALCAFLGTDYSIFYLGNKLGYSLGACLFSGIIAAFALAILCDLMVGVAFALGCGLAISIFMNQYLIVGLMTSILISLAAISGVATEAIAKFLHKNGIKIARWCLAAEQKPQPQQ